MIPDVHLQEVPWCEALSIKCCSVPADGTKGKRWGPSSVHYRERQSHRTRKNHQLVDTNKRWSRSARNLSRNLGLPAMFGLQDGGGCYVTGVTLSLDAGFVKSNIFSEVFRERVSTDGEKGQYDFW